MCAMALVHSRVARVIYCHQNESHGALGGLYRLQAKRSLNHHYKVYHMPLQNAAAGKQQPAQLEQQQPGGQPLAAALQGSRSADKDSGVEGCIEG